MKRGMKKGFRRLTLRNPFRDPPGGGGYLLWGVAPYQKKPLNTVATRPLRMFTMTTSLP